MTVQPATILNSELHTMDSQSTGRTYRITISLPLSYAASPDEDWPFNDKPEKWPVVYVLDGNWHFGMVTGMVRPMSWCGSTSDAIIVGIGYPEGNNAADALRESFVRRDGDMTPIQDEAVQKGMEEQHKRPAPNGDAANFLKFLQDELIPFIEKNYHADPSRRILVGHSYGGLFALFALFTAPDLFSTMVIGSPTLSYGNRVTFQQEEAFAKEHRNLPVKVYMYVSELEESRDDTTLTDTLRMAALLQGRSYEGFSLVKQVLPDLNHCEVTGVGYQIGLKFALKK